VGDGMPTQMKAVRKKRAFSSARRFLPQKKDKKKDV
jgi:hypothetical protein